MYQLSPWCANWYFFRGAWPPGFKWTLNYITSHTTYNVLAADFWAYSMCWMPLMYQLHVPTGIFQGSLGYWLCLPGYSTWSHYSWWYIVCTQLKNERKKSHTCIRGTTLGFYSLLDKINTPGKLELMKEKCLLIPVPTQIFAFQKILIKFNIQIYWNFAIFSLKLSNDPSNVWHLCHWCVQNVPMLYIAGSRHLRMRRCENRYFILINITGQWQNRDYMYTNRFMKRKDIDFVVKV